MSEVEEIEARVGKLPNEAFAQFRAWFYELENERWDQQIRSDFKAGKFDKLITRAREEFAQGKARKF